MSHFFAESVGNSSLSICYSVYEQTAKCVIVLPPCLPMVNMTFSGMDNQKKELVNKSESAAKEKKKITEIDVGND